MSDITSIASVKTLIGVTDSGTDRVLLDLVTAASQALGNYCNRSFDEAEFTEYRDGNGAAMMTLVHYPLVSVSRVEIDGAEIPVSAGRSGRGYRLIPGGRVIVLDGGYRFTKGMRNVVIEGVAGFGGAFDWPADLQFAANQWIATRYNERSRLGVGSKSLAGESVAYTQADPAVGSASTGIPASAKSVLKNYMNTVPESGL